MYISHTSQLESPLRAGRGLRRGQKAPHYYYYYYHYYYYYYAGIMPCMRILNTVLQYTYGTTYYYAYYAIKGITYSY